MSRRVCAHAFVLAMTAAVAGCGDEELESELDTEGPPRVTAVTVPIDDMGIEAPAYCIDETADKVSVICFDEMGNYVADEQVTTLPVGWQVRLVFNELLDPDRAEELVVVRDERDQYGNPIKRGTLVRSQPVILTCNGTAIAYDGYYNPSGNHLSTPPGPSLVIRPLEQAPTSATCQVEVVQGESSPGFGVFDKEGNPVDAAAKGPFRFRTGPMAITGVSPGDAVAGVDLGVAPLVAFNVAIDPASVEAGGVARVRLRTAADDAEIAAVLTVEGGNSVRLTPASPLAPMTEYELVLYGGITDSAGGAPLVPAQEPQVLSTFTTGMAPAGALR
jgi:hypothetical protein